MQFFSIKDISPLAGYVLIEPAENANKTKSGIILPGSDSEKPQHGKVLAVGDAIYQDGQEILSPIKAGANVIYKKWSVSELKVGNKEYIFIKFEDLLAQIK